MKKYWLMSIGFFALLFVSTLIIRVTNSTQGTVLGESTEASAGTSQKPLTNSLSERLPSLNPTGHILRLSITPPERRLTEIPEKKLQATQSGALSKRLTDQKLRICQTASKNIIKRNEYLAKSVSEIEKKLASIIDGIKNYYEEKVIPTGTSLSNYDVLVNDIFLREKAIVPLIEKVKTDTTAFSCTGEDPHGQIKKVDDDIRAVLKALQEYKTGIHTLITAIKELHTIEPTQALIPSVIITP